MNTVIICAYTLERWSQLEAAVASVERQPLVDEVVVVIDHCDELLEMSRRRWPQHRVVANEGAQGLSDARNTGVTASRGDIIAFLDDDAVAAGDWMQQLVQTFDERGVAGVGGHVDPQWMETPPRWFPPEFLWVVGCSYVGQPTAVVEVRNPIGANMAFRRRVFTDVGGFRREVGRVGTLPLGCEETELGIRARAAGHVVVLQPGAVVRHCVPPSRATPTYFVRRCFAEGMSKAVVSAMAGANHGLSAERSYVSRTLPLALVATARRATTGPDRLAAAGKAVAIVAGTSAAALGFAYLTVSRRLRHRALGAAPAVEFVLDTAA